MSRRGIALDANLLVLLIVGQVDPSAIGRHRRLRDFEPADLPLLHSLVLPKPPLVLTPNVLTEASNLLRYGRGEGDGRFAKALREMLPRVTEIYLPTAQAVSRDKFLRLGVTDSVLLEMGAAGHTILTEDLDLYLAAAKAGYDATNFNHVRRERSGL